MLGGEVDDIVSESSSILSTAATDGSSVPSSAAIAAAAAVGPGFNGSFGDDNEDRCSKMECTGSRGRELRWEGGGMVGGRGKVGDVLVRVFSVFLYSTSSIRLLSFVSSFCFFFHSSVAATSGFSGSSF